MLHTLVSAYNIIFPEDKVYLEGRTMEKDPKGKLGGRKCMRAERNIQPPFTGEENAGLREAQ